MGVWVNLRSSKFQGWLFGHPDNAPQPSLASDELISGSYSLLVAGEVMVFGHGFRGPEGGQRGPNHTYLIYRREQHRFLIYNALHDGQRHHL